jgi:molecular chaperone GrpE
MGYSPTGRSQSCRDVGQHPIARGAARAHAGAMLQTDQSNPQPEEPLTTTETEVFLHELAAQKELHLRLAADFENFKRRSRQELESRAAAQKEALIAELLPVIDNLERAVESGAASDTAQLHQGVQITLKQLQQLLRQHGIESGEIVGLPFDPHRHEALSQSHDPSQPDHAILKVLRRGYWRGAQVIRPANVVVNVLAPPTKAHDGR